jgi:hypothetical protein
MMPARDVTVTAVFKDPELSFDAYVEVMWGHALLLNFTNLANSNHVPTACRWYFIPDAGDVISLGEGFRYVSPEDRPHSLRTDGYYRFVLTTSAAGELYSTNKRLTHAASNSSLNAHPNPVVSGNMFTIEGVEEGSQVEVFNLQGVRVHTTVATSSPFMLTLNLPTGIYVVRTRNGEVRIVVN